MKKLLILIMMIALSSFVSGAVLDIDDNLLSYWKGNGTVLDEQGNYTLVPATTEGYSDGAFGQGFWINDTQFYLNESFSSATCIDETYAFDFFMNTSVCSIYAGSSYLISFYTDASNWGWLRCGEGDNKADLLIRKSGRADLRINAVGSSLIGGALHHLGVSQNDTHLSLWLDGVQLGTQTNGSISGLHNTFSIASTSAGDSGQSMVDDVAFWCVAKESDYMIARYNSGSFAELTSPVVADIIPPYFTDNATNSSEPYIDDDVNVSIIMNDETALDTYIFSYYNESGSEWLNDSVSDISGTSYNAQKIVTIPDQNYYNYTWFANDTSDNWNKSDNYYLDVQGLRDLIPPYFTNNATNSSLPRLEDHVNLSITINDDFNVSGYIFSYYNGTLWLNDTFAVATGTSYDASVVKTITNTSYYNYTWFANDTTDNWNKSDEYYLEIWTPDETIPAFKNATTNDTWTLPYSHVRLSINITDNINVSGYIFSFYNGTWNNDSYVENVGDEIYATVVKVMTNLTFYNFTWFANDTSDNWGKSSNYFLRINHFPPVFNTLTVNDTTVFYRDFIKTSVVINDSNPDRYYFEWNLSGTWQISAVNTYTDGENVSTNRFVAIPHVNTCWRYFANDTGGNGAYSNTTCFTIQNTVPTQPVIVSPLNNTNVSTLDIQYSSYDFDLDVLDYLVYINNTLEFNSTTNTSDYTVSDGDYSLKVQAYDDYGYSVNSSEIFFTKITTAVVEEEDAVLSAVITLGSIILAIVVVLFILLGIWKQIKQKGKGVFEK